MVIPSLLWGSQGLPSWPSPFLLLCVKSSKCPFCPFPLAVVHLASHAPIAPWPLSLPQEDRSCVNAHLPMQFHSLSFSPHFYFFSSDVKRSCSPWPVQLSTTAHTGLYSGQKLKVFLAFLLFKKNFLKKFKLTHHWSITFYTNQNAELKAEDSYSAAMKTLVLYLYIPTIVKLQILSRSRNATKQRRHL